MDWLSYSISKMKTRKVSYFRLIQYVDMSRPISVTSKKLSNVYKSYSNMVSIEKLKILTPLQKIA